MGMDKIFSKVAHKKYVISKLCSKKQAVPLFDMIIKSTFCVCQKIKQHFLLELFSHQPGRIRYHLLDGYKHNIILALFTCNKSVRDKEFMSKNPGKWTDG